MESLLYKTPSPGTAKRRLSGIPVRATATSRGAPQSVPKDVAGRIVSPGDSHGAHDASCRRRSFCGSTDILNRLDEETESVFDSSMGFRELERHIAKIKRQNFDLKLELHLRRERMTANAEKIHRAEKLALENEELRETLREIRSTIKTREDEIADCRSLIRLLSDQLETAHKRIASLTDQQKSLPSISIPSPTTEGPDGMSLKDTPTSENSAYHDASDDSILTSPISLVSLESGIKTHSDEEEPMDTTVIKLESDDPFVEEKQTAESIHGEIHLPPKLEHCPRTVRRQSMLDQIRPLPSAHSTFCYHDRHRGPLLPSKRNPKLVTPIVTHVNVEVSKTHLTPTPEETPLPMKQATQRAARLRSRIFRSKSALNDLSSNGLTSVERRPTAPPTATKFVTKKNSLLRFWASKISSPGEDQRKSSSAAIPGTEAVANVRLSTRYPGERSNVFAAPHESDQLSRYLKVRPTTSYPTTRTTSTTATTNPEWRRSVGRQVSEMVQHWEHESNTCQQRPLSCAAYVSSKCTSSSAANLKDSGVTAANAMAVRAARDAWTLRASSTAGSLSRSSSLRSAGLGGEGLRRSRDELGRKMG